MDNFILLASLRDAVIVNDNARIVSSSSAISLTTVDKQIPALSRMTRQDVRKAYIRSNQQRISTSSSLSSSSSKSKSPSSSRRKLVIQDLEQNRWLCTPLEKKYRAPIVQPKRRASGDDIGFEVDASPSRPERKKSLKTKRSNSMQFLSLDALQMALSSLDSLDYDPDDNDDEDSDDLDDNSEHSNTSTECAYSIYQNRRRSMEEMLLKPSVSLQ